MGGIEVRYDGEKFVSYIDGKVFGDGRVSSPTGICSEKKSRMKEKLEELSKEQFIEGVNTRRIKLLGTMISESYTALPIVESDQKIMKNKGADVYARGEYNRDSIGNVFRGDLGSRELHPAIALLYGKRINGGSD